MGPRKRKENDTWWVLTKRNENDACQKGCRGEWEGKMAKNGALNGGWRVHRRSPETKAKINYWKLILSAESQLVAKLVRV